MATTMNSGFSAPRVRHTVVGADTASRLQRWLGGFARTFANGLARAERALATRDRLATLDDRMLKDLGITKAQADFEVSRRWH